ncbi:MAG TPA: S-layer homology domain-containing protein [Thermoanaerobaculaceae bacterium]|nr:S-layer homology domain-containing protein [Thermoanaerobaculaceae bacterium]
MTYPPRSRICPIVALLGIAALLTVPGTLSAATCAAPVPYDDLAGREIYCSFMKAVDDAGVMDACGARYFCPYELVSREDMELFIEQGLEVKWPDPGHTIGTPTGRFSGDVPVTYGLAPWIEQLGADLIASGCETTPPPRFCPYNLVTRAEMAVFISKAKIWSTPEQIDLSGTLPSGQSYDCHPVEQGGHSAFSDVDPGHWSCKYIHYMAVTGVTSGCETTPVLKFCPNDPTPRWQMAVFVSRAFGL